MLGSRVNTIGPMRVSYDRLGNRPNEVHQPEAEASLTGEHLLVLFLVLQLLAERRRRASDST